MSTSNEHQVCKNVFAVANDFEFIDERIKQNIIDKDSIKVSIVIPYYNEPLRLRRTLMGLSNQTVSPSNFEIIICDDGSDEDISYALLEWRNLFENIKLIKEQKKGFQLSKMRNNGLMNAKYFNIILLDCDMMPTQKLVESHLEVLFACHYCLSIGYRHHSCMEQLTDEQIKSLQQRDFQLNELDWRASLNNSLDGLKSMIKYDSYISWSIASGGNIGLTKKVLDENIWFDENFKVWGGEDNEWAYRLFKKGFYFYPNFKAVAIHQDLEIPIIRNKQACLEYLMNKCPRIQDAYKLDTYDSNTVPLLSFWMCNNNRGKYIEQAIRSLMSCPYRFEIVVVDDGSDDDSIQVIQNLNIPQVRLVPKSKGTLGEAYKLALDSCRGEIFIQVDSDDFISDMGGLIELVIAMMSGSYGLVYGHHFLVNENGDFLRDGWIYPKCDRQKLLFEGMHIHPPRLIHSRDYNRARSINEELDTAVDYDLYSKIIEVSDGLFINKDIYAYRQHAYSVSANFEDSQKTNIPRIIRERLTFYGFMDKVFFDSDIPRACKTRLINESDLLEIKNKFTEGSY